MPPRDESKSAAPLTSGSFVKDYLLFLFSPKVPPRGIAPLPPCRGPAYTAVLNMIRFPDRDPTGFCNAEPDPVGVDFEKNNSIRYRYPNCNDHCSKMLNQTFLDINRIGSNIWTGLPDKDRTGLFNENFRLDLDCKNLRFVQH